MASVGCSMFKYQPLYGDSRNRRPCAINQSINLILNAYLWTFVLDFPLLCGMLVFHDLNHLYSPDITSYKALAIVLLQYAFAQAGH